MKLYKRGTVWWADMNVMGQRLRASTAETNKRAAETKAQELYDEFRAKVLADRDTAKAKKAKLEAVSLKEVVHAMLEARRADVKSGALGARTHEEYCNVAKRTFGGLKERKENLRATSAFRIDESVMLHELDQELLDMLVQERVSEGYSGSAINHELTVISLTLKWAKRSKRFIMPEDYGTLEFNRQRLFQRRRLYSIEEEEAILKRLRSSPLDSDQDAADLFEFLIQTGLRRGEAAILRWTAIDFKHSRMEVYRPKVAKTDNAMGLIDLSEKAMTILKRRHDAKLPKPFPDNLDLLYRRAQAVINALCNTDEDTVERFGKATLHSCRDTFVTRLNAAGLPLDQVKDLVGHSSTVMTKKYRHLDQSALSKRAKEILDALNRSA